MSQKNHGSDTRFSGTKDLEKQEPGHHMCNIKSTETRLYQNRQTNTKVVAEEKLKETTERP